MGRLPALNGREVVGVLEAAGYHIVSQRGSHIKLRREDTIVIVPVHGSKPLKRPTLVGILKDAGLTIEEVQKLLR